MREFDVFTDSVHLFKPDVERDRWMKNHSAVRSVLRTRIGSRP